MKNCKFIAKADSLFNLQRLSVLKLLLTQGILVLKPMLIAPRGGQVDTVRCYRSIFL